LVDTFYTGYDITQYINNIFYIGYVGYAFNQNKY